jgi:hypothetical protein
VLPSSRPESSCGLRAYRKLGPKLPATASAFRNANEGVAATKSTWENRVIECFTLNPRWECDKAVADRYEDGAQAFIALEADGIMRASMLTLGSQFYYGITNGDAKGFPGLLAAYDSTNMVVDATGTTASTVWAVKFGPQAVQWVLVYLPSQPPKELESEQCRIGLIRRSALQPLRPVDAFVFADGKLNEGERLSIAAIELQRTLRSDIAMMFQDAVVGETAKHFTDGRDAPILPF